MMLLVNGLVAVQIHIFLKYENTAFLGFIEFLVNKT